MISAHATFVKKPHGVIYSLTGPSKGNRLESTEKNPSWLQI